MANVPSGIGNMPSGNAGGGNSLPANLNLAPASYNFPGGLPLAGGAGNALGPAPAAGPTTGLNSSAPLNVSGALMQTLGAGSQMNPMTVFELMNLDLGASGAPLAGGGPLGYPPAVPGASMFAPSGSPVGGAFTGGAPIPQSGGKGVMG